MPYFYTFLNCVFWAIVWNSRRNGVTASVCPSGAREAGDKCIKYHEGKYSWSEARSFCKTHYQTDLLIVNNIDVFRDIQGAVQNRRDHGFWVGATRQGSNFRWVDGSTCCGGYWNAGEPNGAQGSGDDCVHLWNDGTSKGLNDVRCDDPIGFLCEECPEIQHCKTRHCSNVNDVVCDDCYDDNVFYKRTNGNKKCERMCSFDTHACWPGTCSNDLTSSCACGSEFQKIDDSGQTTCKLKDSSTPTINDCQTVISGANKEAKRTVPGKCHKLEDFYGNFQPKSLKFDMHSDFKVDITTLSTTRPRYIAEEHFGITDTTLIVKAISVKDVVQKNETFKQKTDASNSIHAETEVINQGTVSLSSLYYTLADGEMLCVQYQAKGGGYVKRKDVRHTPNTVLPPLPYEKTTDEETICYRYDIARPKHCLITGTCSNGEKEPIQVDNRITRTSIIPLRFSGWLDPLPVGGTSMHASGIETFEITVNEVVNGSVRTNKVFGKKLGPFNTAFTLNLTSDTPRLYAINLEVKDVADNVQQARRFVLYDGTTNISSRNDKPFTVVSASSATNYSWQTHHNSICLDWTDHFYNKFYMDNSMLGKIKPDSNGIITGIYEQNTGLLPVNGTTNVFGITEFRFTWSLDGMGSKSEIIVPDVLKQAYCHSFHSMKDGQTYTLNIEAIDIVNNTFSENRTAHIDRTVPHINNIWLTKSGVKRLFVHDKIDLSKMNLTFEALDPHSGLLNIEWTFSTMDGPRQLGSGVIGISVLEKEICPRNTSSSCYCPDIGQCENFLYSIPLNKLVNNNTHVGNHNRNYLFTIKVTNKARLSNVEQIDILVDDSPPETGVVYEGVPGSPDIDYTSDSSFTVRWHGFIDHESGIREYRLGLSDICLRKEDLLSPTLNRNITEYKTVQFTEESIRLDANFTGRKVVSLIAINNAMGASDAVCSDGITRDINPRKIENIRVQNGKWSESLVCINGEAWFLRADMTTTPLSDTGDCAQRCINDTSGQELIRLLPTEKLDNNKTSVTNFLCKYLPLYSTETIIYLPNDNMFITWDSVDGGSQIESYYVGFGRTSSALSIMDYKSTDKKLFFHTRHIGVSAGELFYANIKTVNKANLEAVSLVGPIMIDETPPIFTEKPIVSIDGDFVLTGWSNDTIYDLEQRERINNIIFQIVHDGEVVSPLLEWRFEDSKPCQGFTGGCLRYPLKRLQKMDTDLGLNFTVRVYAYNNAGHFSLIETEPFRIPSQYPPGHAVVLDIDPGRQRDQVLQDIDVHFTANQVCSYWNGFRHHEHVKIEIGLGTNKTNADVLPFQLTNASSATCIQAKEIHLNTQYYVLLRASCSGGETISASNGFTIVNKTDLTMNLNVAIGDNYGDIAMVDATTSNGSDIEKCSPENLHVGEEYTIIFPHNVSVESTDFVLKDNTYNNYTAKFELRSIPLGKRPCIKIISDRKDDMSVLLSKTNVDGFVNGRRKLAMNLNYSKMELLTNLIFKTSLVAISGNSTSIEFASEWRQLSDRTTHIFDLGNYTSDRVYAVAVMPCTRVYCSDYIVSSHFQVEHAIYQGDITQSVVTIRSNKKCLDVSFSWRGFDAESGITLYQWAVSRDREANTLLTKWKGNVVDERSKFEVNDCVNLPVHGHSTVYLCVKVYSAVGNTVAKCVKASTIMEAEFSVDTVYDIDITSTQWPKIQQMLHSSNIGKEFSVLHDSEVDFGLTDAVMAGVLLHATERNVTWYLMKQPNVPKIGCDKDKDCVHSQTNGDGFVSFNADRIKTNQVHYVCAYSNVTSISRETIVETFQEIVSCSNGFLLDDITPTAGIISVTNTNGFLTGPSSLEISWTGFDDNIDVSVIGYLDRIKHYAYAIGTRIGGADIQNYTVVGSECAVDVPGLSISDGTDVYVTVKATDQAGLTVTKTSDQLTVDTSPPIKGSVVINGAERKTSYISSLVCEILLSGFLDRDSGIDHFEVGVGSDEFSQDNTDEIYKLDHFFYKMPNNLNDGHKYYIMVKAVNRAGLSTIPVAVPFIFDQSPPTGGHVLDGDVDFKKDVDYQHSLGYVQGHWNGFVDPHSGIQHYRAGLGTKPENDDVEGMVNVGLLTDIIWNGTYHTGQKYYIIVEACNFADLCRTISSDGIVLDNSPPIQGVVRVGSGGSHQKYLPQNDSLHVQWAGFEDPQSGIDHYDVCLGTNPGKCDVLPYSSSLLQSSTTKTGLNIHTGIDLYASVTAYNKAGMSATSFSDAFRIDNTPPELIKRPSFLRDFNAITGEKAQWDRSVLRLSWKFKDAESKVAFHIISLKTHHEGHTPVENIHLGNIDKLTLNLDSNNWLHNGDVYFVVVTGCNVAGLCASERSDDLLVDSTPPHQGGFKPPLKWENHVYAKNTTISTITLTWYGFIDAESSIAEYYLTVSRNYSGHELSGVVVHKAGNQTDETIALNLTDRISHDDILILSLWAKNNAGLNSTIAKISVTALSSERGSSNVSSGILEIQKHSCDVHYCNKDCTCAILGQQCVEVETNDTCHALNTLDIISMGYPKVDVFGGLPENSQNITASSACLAGHWRAKRDEHMIQRYEWSMGVQGQPEGEGIFDLKVERPWKDVGKGTQTVYCLQTSKRLEHDTGYVIYVRAWYTKTEYSTFSSDPISVDQTPPHRAKGKIVKDADISCKSDFDVIDWMDDISACWNGVFTENTGNILHFTVSLGTTMNGSDIHPTTNVGLQTNITLTNLTLSHGTKYFFTVTAYNDVGLHTTVTSDGFSIDMDTPVEGVVFNTLKHTDISHQSSVDTFNISLHGFVDQYSGIRYYSVGIVDVSLEDYTNVSFTNIGIHTKHTFQNLHLEQAKAYLGLVRAFDNAGHVSKTVVSNPRMVDKTPPQALTCIQFDEENISITENDNTIEFTTNLSINHYYSVKGRFSNISLETMPIISIGKRHMYLPFAVNNNGSVDFQYNFISPLSGETTVSVSTNIEKRFSSFYSDVVVDLHMLSCSLLEQADDDSKAVIVEQIGPSKVAVNCLIMDKESSLYKVYLGAGTTPGGFQIRPLSPLHGGTSGILDVHVDHDTHIYVTVLAENHAGLRSVFKAYPMRMDSTPPLVSDIEITVTVAGPDQDSNFTETNVNVTAKWVAKDRESGIKYCLCGLGHRVQSTDIADFRVSDSSELCVFHGLLLLHGDSVFVTVECISNVEMATSVVSKETIILTGPADVDTARLNILTAGSIWNPHHHSSLTPDHDLVTYVQTDKSRVLVEWEGFRDPSGVKSYEYRLTFDNETVADWTTAREKNLVDLKGLSLDPGKLYRVEVRAINSWNFISQPVSAGLIVHMEPFLTGKPASFVKDGGQLKVDWSEIFSPGDSLKCIYDVSVGSRVGFSDVTELRQISTSRYVITLPRSTLVTPRITELFVKITCTYPVGLFNVYSTNYKL